MYGAEALQHHPLQLREKLSEGGIDIPQKESDSLIFGKNEREKKRITRVIRTEGETLREASMCVKNVHVTAAISSNLSNHILHL